jgi:hypothetical protein
MMRGRFVVRGGKLVWSKSDGRYFSRRKPCRLRTTGDDRRLVCFFRCHEGERRSRYDALSRDGNMSVVGTCLGRYFGKRPLCARSGPFRGLTYFFVVVTPRMACSRCHLECPSFEVRNDPVRQAQRRKFFRDAVGRGQRETSLGQLNCRNPLETAGEGE